MNRVVFLVRIGRIYVNEIELVVFDLAVRLKRKRLPRFMICNAS